MVHMERDTGPTGPIAVLSGRRNGKTAALDEISEQTESAWAAGKRGQRELAAENDFHAQQHRLERKEARRGLELYRRRYEFPTGSRTGGATAPVACPHLRRVWWQEPHPRYGEAVPFFRSAMRRVKGAHVCIPGAKA